MGGAHEPYTVMSRAPEIFRHNTVFVCVPTKVRTREVATSSDFDDASVEEEL